MNKNNRWRYAEAGLKSNSESKLRSDLIEYKQKEKSSENLFNFREFLRIYFFHLLVVRREKKFGEGNEYQKNKLQKYVRSSSSEKQKSSFAFTPSPHPPSLGYHLRRSWEVEIISSERERDEKPAADTCWNNTKLLDRVAELHSQVFTSSSPRLVLLSANAMLIHEMFQLSNIAHYCSADDRFSASSMASGSHVSGACVCAIKICEFETLLHCQIIKYFVHELDIFSKLTVYICSQN